MERNLITNRIRPLPGARYWCMFMSGVRLGRKLNSDPRRTGWSGVGGRDRRGVGPQMPQPKMGRVTMTLQNRLSPTNSAGLSGGPRHVLFKAMIEGESAQQKATIKPKRQVFHVLLNVFLNNIYIIIRREILF